MGTYHQKRRSEDFIIKLDGNLNNNNYLHISIFNHNINHFLYNLATLILEIIYLDYPIFTRQARKHSQNKSKTKGHLKNKLDGRFSVNHESVTFKNLKFNGEIPSLIAEADVNCLTLPSSARGSIGCVCLLRGDRCGPWPCTGAGLLRFQLWKHPKECVFNFFHRLYSHHYFQNQLSFLTDLQKKRYKS